MERLIIASMHENAGKTSLICGMACSWKHLKIAYMKPLGDRLQYEKKRLWDHDASLMTHLLGLKESVEDMTIGFEHSKLRYTYNEEGMRHRLNEMVNRIGSDNDILLVETGRGITYGASIHLDALSIARYIKAKLLMVIGGSDETIMDDLRFLVEDIDLSDIDLKGVIVNKVSDIDDFKVTNLDAINELGIPILGTVPFDKRLSHHSVEYLANVLFAKVIAGTEGIKNTVENIFVGAMSANAAMRNPIFSTKNKLIITSGDRTDMILAALETDTSCIILTNNILPPSNMISKASEKNIPLLLTPQDTYQVAKIIDDAVPLLTQGDTEKVELLEKMVSEHVDLKGLLG